MEFALIATLSHLNKRQINASRETTDSKTSLTNVKLRSLYHWYFSPNRDLLQRGLALRLLDKNAHVAKFVIAFGFKFAGRERFQLVQNLNQGRF
jgi:hypothetical protein